MEPSRRDRVVWLINEVINDTSAYPGSVDDLSSCDVLMILHTAAAAIMFGEEKGLAAICLGFCEEKEADQASTPNTTDEHLDFTA